MVFEEEGWEDGDNRGRSGFSVWKWKWREGGRRYEEVMKMAMIRTVRGKRGGGDFTRSVQLCPPSEKAGREREGKGNCHFLLLLFFSVLVFSFSPPQV